MAKRITFERVKNWLIGIGAIGIPASIGLFFLITSLGSATITGMEYDSFCVGTVEEPCNVYINMSFTEDVFIYPNDNWTQTAFITDPQAESIKLYRSWGSSWREIPLDQKCTGTWCGGTGTYEPEYSYAFRSGRDYQLKIELVRGDITQDLNFSLGI